MTAKRRHPARIRILYCHGFTSHRLLRALVGAASERGWLVTPLYDATSLPLNDLITQLRPAGIISHHLPAGSRLIASACGRLPHVTLNAQTATELDMPGVVMDHFQAGRLLGQHFSSLNFEHVVVVSIPHAVLDARLEGIQAHMRERVLPPPQLLTIPETVRANSQAQTNFIADALLRLPKPIAVIAPHDQLALSVIYACWEAGLECPSEVSVCGFDNDPISCDLSPIPLSSIDTDPERQALGAVEMLDDLLAGTKPEPRQVLVPPKGVIVRRSSGAMACTNPIVARALSYIHEHNSKSDLSIPEIAESQGIAACTLHVAFKKELHMTPLTYITDLRVNKARQLIQTTDQKINEVRPQCGFASDYQMYKAFKRTTGKSPGSFR